MMLLNVLIHVVLGHRHNMNRVCGLDLAALASDQERHDLIDDRLANLDGLRLHGCH
jgi:hypothetical protein